MDIGKSSPAVPEISAFSIRYTPPQFDTRGDRSSDSEDFLLPPPPPNTARHSGQSSAIHSQPQTPEEDEEESPIEFNTRALLARPRSAQPTGSAASPDDDHLAVPTVPRRRSLPASTSIQRNLAGLGTKGVSKFRSHRDSVEITQRLLKRQEVEGKGLINQQLLNSHRDSFIITKSKFETRYPKPGLTSSQSWNRFGGLSPIMDSSPPRSYEWTVRSSKIVPSPEESPGQVVKMLEFEEPHPDEHKDCPIYEVERPRWFEANFRK